MKTKKNIAMKALDQLICIEEKRIDYLMQKRNHAEINDSTGSVHDSPSFEGLDYDIEKAHEQLAIYKIRKYMGFDAE
jgi:isoleucyl-tRNA synthetase